MGFSKLHSSLVNSSLWTEPDSTRILFITLLALCDREGIVSGSKMGISRIANIDPDEIDLAWESLMSPDKDSSDRLRNPENEGRRIREIPGGFQLLNYAYYRGLRNEDDRREQNRQAQERSRAKSAKVSRGKPESAGVSPEKPRSSHADADADADADAVPPKTPTNGRGWNPTEEQIRLGALFRRRETTKWDAKELKAYRAIGKIDPEDLELIEWYYNESIPEGDFRRKDLVTLLNNFSGELDRARNYQRKVDPPIKYADAGLPYPDEPPIQERLKPLLDKMVEGAAELRSKENQELL